MTVHAIFENGVFRPTETVSLPEHTRVEFEPKIIAPAKEDTTVQQRIFDVLMRSYDTGQTDAAARHNEHQP